MERTHVAGPHSMTALQKASCTSSKALISSISASSRIVAIFSQSNSVLSFRAINPTNRSVLLTGSIKVSDPKVYSVLSGVQISCVHRGRILAVTQYAPQQQAHTARSRNLIPYQ
uniref:Uncharacterized protein n=1 Tax=Spironucleus salmonicida TaxID=348837 RepID=V6LTZ1_9EUKA|eukprot:EST47688.1 Hypothetical protein SS50377_12243 [Spironucleus salmonicida]